MKPNMFAGPNVELVPVCRNGISPTLIAVKIKTRNLMGVASRTLLVANYGLDFDFGAMENKPSDEDAKRFRGRLDALFAAQRGAEAQENEGEEDLGTPEKPPSAGQTGDPKPVPSEGTSAADDGFVQLSAHELFFFGTKGEKNDLKLFVKPTDDVKSNKKLAPNTLLCFVGAGRIKKTSLDFHQESI